MTERRHGIDFRQRLVILFFFAFLVSAYAWHSASRVPWESGQVRVLVLQLLPAGEVPSQGLLRLNGTLPSLDGTIESAEDWLSQEYGTYVPCNVPLNVQFDVVGPHAVETDPPDLVEPGISTWKRALRAFSFYWYFRRLAADLGVEFDSYDARVIVVLDGASGDVEAGSMADPKQRFGVVHLDPSIPDPNYALITILHELGHTLGATDKYDADTFLARFPEGYAEPLKDPVHPQEFGEIMAVDIPVSSQEEREPTRLGALRVGARTAAEIGWIPAETAEALYGSLPAGSAVR